MTSIHSNSHHIEQDLWDLFSGFHVIEILETATDGKDLHLGDSH